MSRHHCMWREAAHRKAMHDVCKNAPMRATGAHLQPAFLSTDAVDKDVNSLPKTRVSQLRIRLFYIVMKK